MEVFWVRHTRVKVSKDICYGQSDVLLADSFNKDYQEIRKKLPQRALCYFSSLTRCSQLAKSLYHEKYLFEENRLLEYNFGDWDGKKWNEIPEEELNPWMENFVTNRPPNGETYIELQQRVVNFIEELRNQNNKSPVVIITHAGVIRSALSYLLSIPLAETFKMQFDYGFLIKTTLSETKQMDQVFL